MPDNLLSPERLTQKLGSKPVWFYGVIGGVVLLGGYYVIQARKNARQPNAGVNGTASQDLNSVNTGLATPSQTADATLPVSGYSGGTIGDGTTPDNLNNTGNALGTTSLETNVSWLQKGIRAATANNRHTALGSTTALQKYLQGKPLTKDEADVVNVALNVNGYPPESAPLAVKVIQDAVGTYQEPSKITPVAPKPVATTPVVTTPVAPKTTTVNPFDPNFKMPRFVSPFAPKPYNGIPASPTH